VDELLILICHGVYFGGILIWAAHFILGRAGSQKATKQASAAAVELEEYMFIFTGTGKCLQSMYCW
jgi:hypothetical protein